MSVLNCEAALFALEHADVFAAQAAELRAQRTVLIEALRAMPGIEKGLGQRGQHGAGARGRRRQDLRGHENPQGPDQERFYNAPIAAQLFAPDRGQRPGQRHHAGSTQASL